MEKLPDTKFEKHFNLWSHVGGYFGYKHQFFYVVRQLSKKSRTTLIHNIDAFIAMKDIKHKVFKIRSKGM
jgi:hypothetical protein